MTGIRIGYACCSTDKQDLTAQHQAPVELGVEPDRIYIDHGLTGTSRNRPGLDQPFAAPRPGDTLVVPKLDRLARSVPDARSIGDDLAERGIALALGTTTYDPADPMGKMLFNILATFAEFEVDLLRLRTREGMPSPKPKASCAANNPSSPPASRPTWCSYTLPAATPSPISPNCSESPAPPCTGFSNLTISPAAGDSVLTNASASGV